MADDTLKIQKLAGDRTELIDKIISALERKVGGGQTWLIKSIVEDIIDKMDKDGDRIKNSQANKRLVSLVDTVFNAYAKDKGLEVVKSVVDGVGKVVDFGGRYFSALTEPAKLGKIQPQVTKDLSVWLGIDKDGQVEENGYLSKLVEDTTVRNKVKDMAMSAVVGQAGYNDTKKAFSDYITGGEEETGALKKYYRNFVYDMFSQVDRVNSKLFADRLNFRFAIYEGGIIKTSRKFCRDKNGNVYHREEIAAWEITEARPPGYNPFTDLGGYGCRHHLNWIPDAVAYSMRPELRTLYPPGSDTTQETATEENPPAPKKPADSKAEPAPERQAKDTPFNEVKTPPISSFKPTAQMLSQSAKARTEQLKFAKALTDANEAVLAYNAMSKKLAKTLAPDKRSEILAELEELMKNYKTTNAAYVEARKARDKAKETAADSFRKELIKGLGKSNVEITMSTGAAKSKPLTNKVKEATDFFRVAVEGYMENGTIGVELLKGRNGRAFHLDGTIHVSEKTPIKTIIHEMAHAAESHNTVLKAAVDFWEKRTAGNPFRSLKELNRAYGSNEIYKEGGFAEAYNGKVYPGSSSRAYKGIRATEIISMGLEKMYDDPGGFYAQDKEYFNFIYSTFFKR